MNIDIQSSTSSWSAPGFQKPAHTCEISVARCPWHSSNATGHGRHQLFRASGERKSHLNLKKKNPKNSPTLSITSELYLQDPWLSLSMMLWCRKYIPLFQLKSEINVWNNWPFSVDTFVEKWKDEHGTLNIYQVSSFALYNCILTSK